MFCLAIAASDKCPTDFDNFDSCSYYDRLILPYGECGFELPSIEEATSQPNVTFNNAEVTFRTSSFELIENLIFQPMIAIWIKIIQNTFIKLF